MPADGTLAARSDARTSARPASKAVLKSSRFRGREEYGSASQLGQNPVVLWSSTRIQLRPQNPTSARRAPANAIFSSLDVRIHCPAPWRMGLVVSLTRLAPRPRFAAAHPSD